MSRAELMPFSGAPVADLKGRGHADLRSGFVVAKFGGTSMASAETVKRSVEIIYSDARRNFIIPSAPGKRHPKDTKVTDQLLTCNKLVTEGESFDSVFDEIEKRYSSIGNGVGCQNVYNWLNQVYEGIARGEKDWTASRGEWMMGHILAETLGAKFVDASEVIRLTHNGEVDPATYALIKEKIAGQIERQVIPGFYGTLSNGKVKTFPRGGSDISGAIIAAGVDAMLYENWSDVDGVKRANPKVVKEAQSIDELTCEEMRELGYRGAEILQRDTVLPAVQTGIPINVRNTFNPEHPGTLIFRKRTTRPGESITGIAGKEDFVSIQVSKTGMNKGVGVAEKALEVLAENDVAFEHMPSGLDNLSIIVNQRVLDSHQKTVIMGIKRAINPDEISITNNLGLLCVVGQGIAGNAARVSANLFSSLDEAGIDVRSINHSTDGISVVVGVNGDRLNDAIKAVHDRFFPNNNKIQDNQR